VSRTCGARALNGPFAIPALFTVSKKKRYDGRVVERSTRLSIVEHALSDVVERLADLPRSADPLRLIAQRYAEQIGSWETNPPDEASRVALLKRVLDLNVEVMRAGGTTIPPPPSDDDDDDFPKPV